MLNFDSVSTIEPTIDYTDILGK